MITIVNPPNPPNAVSNKDMMGGLGQLYGANAKQRIPPLDIPYAASTIRSKGIPVRIIDCLGENLELSELLLRMKEQKSELIAIRTSTPTLEWDMQVTQLIKIVTNSRIVIFGPHVALLPEQILSLPFVDAIVLAEPELTLLDVALHAEFKGCNGVWYKENGNIIKNEIREPIEDLDKLPFPAWDLMPYHAYDGIELMRNLKPFVTAITSRGCPRGCTYCPYPVAQGRKSRLRSPKNVLDELEWLVNGLGVKAVLFRDPEFAFYRERVIDVCEGILKRSIRLAWRCETRLEDMDQELIALMAKAGCIGINMGLESADEQVLRNVRRKVVPLKQAIKIIKICKKKGIATFCFFILGLPGETRKSALRTIDYALKLNPTLAQFTVATPYPGTELKRWGESKGFIVDNSLAAITGYKAVMRNEYMTVDEIQWLQRFAREAFEMQFHKVFMRLLNNFLQFAFEGKRLLRFFIARFFDY